MRTLPGRKARALTIAGYAPGQSGLWLKADPVLRDLLIILMVVWYIVLLLPVNQILFALSTPLADFLMSHLQWGDIFSFLAAYTFWACLWQSLFASMCYFSCGWPPIARAGQPLPPHGLGPALRATYWYLLADAILFFPFFVLYLFIYSGFQISVVIFVFLTGILLPAVLFLLLGGLLLNALLALTLGLGAYWLAARLGSPTGSERRRKRRNEASGPTL
ncbi:hypothetical protein [Thermogemmatispora tikiterensis]|nr:hypothetical protein [Thermogemmatispora tikiterensis]